MVSEQNKDVAERAKRLYLDDLQKELQTTSPGQFVAIEPDSGDHFLAPSFNQAVAKARQAHPTRLSFVIRIGHDAAVHIGGMMS